MQDGIIKGTGNSRYLKSISNFLTQYPTYQAFVAALAAGTLPIDLNGINETGWDQLGTALNKANLLSDETAEALGFAAQSVTTDLSGVQAGDIVSIPHNGVLLGFKVLSTSYESGLNGAGYVLLQPTATMLSRTYWDSDVPEEQKLNTYATCSLDTYLNGDFLGQFPQEVQSALLTTTFYYTPGNNDNTVTTLSRKVFLLSATEFGKSPQAGSYVNFNVEGTALPNAQLDAENQGTRTIFIRSTEPDRFVQVYTSGYDYAYASSSAQLNFRPCFCLPSTFAHTWYVYDGEITSAAPTISPVPDDALAVLAQRAPVGTVLWYGGAAAPDGYLLCDGSLVSRTTYAALFAAIGTTFGAGDGSATFQIPDLRAKFIRGAGDSGDYSATLGETQESTSFVSGSRPTALGTAYYDSYEAYQTATISTYSGTSDTGYARVGVRPYNLALTPIIKY